METAAVLLKKKVSNPKLRFKEFNDDWKIDSLANLYSEIVVGFVGTVSSDYCDEREGVQFVRTLNVKDGWFSNEGLQYVSKTFHLKNKKSQVKNGDILIARVGANMGLVCEINGLIGEANSANVIIIKNQTDLSSRFYASYLSSSKGQKQIQSKGAGGAQEVLNISVAKTINVPFLSLPEQQKIASFLTAVDEKIQQLTRKKELLEQYKKGVMQQLFSGKLRFKDENGKAFPEWEEKLYGDVYSFYSTNSFSRDNLNYENGRVKNIHYGDIHTKFTTLFDVKREIVPFLNDDIDISKIKEENYCKEGDLVIADASEDYADIGKSIELVKLNNEKVVAGLHTFLARPNKITMHLGFSGHLVKASYVRKQIMTIAQGTKVLSLSTGRLGKVKLKIPVIEEQKKIADYLFNIDNKIENIDKQITQTQTFKKGLLQQMFV